MFIRARRTNLPAYFDHQLTGSAPRLSVKLLAELVADLRRLPKPRDRERRERRRGFAVEDHLAEAKAHTRSNLEPGPQKPKAWNRPGVVSLGPITGIMSGR